MKQKIVISNARNRFIELIHRDSDPNSWIVRRLTKIMWFKKRISSHWFIDEKQAATFANEIKHDYQNH